MKNKKYILGALTLCMMCFGIGVGATHLYNATQVSYDPNNAELGIDNVDDALNELYELTDRKPITLGIGNDVLTNSITIEKSGKYNALLYFTTSNNAETTARNITISRNGSAIYTESYTSNYNPYLKLKEIGEYQFEAGDIITIGLNKSDNYSVDVLILY